MAEANTRREPVRTKFTYADQRRLADAVPQIVWFATPEGSFTYFNQYWTDQTGLSSDDSLGTGWQAAVHPTDVADYLTKLSEARDRGETHEVEFRLKCQGSGEYRWHRTRVTPLRDEDGQIVEWLGASIDIDDQKRAREVTTAGRAELEELVARRTEELNKTNADLQAQITERELESKKEVAFREDQGRILELIAANVPLHEVLARLMLLIEAQHEEMFCSVLLLSEDGLHVRHGAAPSLPEHYVRAVDGAPIGPKNGSCGTAMYLGKQVIVTDIFHDPLWEDYRALAAASGLRACWSTPIMSAAGKVLGSFAMYYREPRVPTGDEAKLTDVATHIAGLAIEHQRAKESLQRAQAELAHVSRVTTMGELAASIAHEVNQPLGAIIGNADVCLQWLKADNPDLDDLRETLEDIANDGRRASDVIARIRTLVKKTPPQNRLLDLNGVVSDVVTLLNHEAQRKHVSLLTELKDVPEIMGDRIQLQQVLLNLAMNGIDAMSDIREREHQLLFSTVDHETGILVAVKDSGIGIKPDEADRIFRPFHTTKASGMGMGLAISRSIVEAHGGRLWAEKNPDYGATFKLILPVPLM